MSHIILPKKWRIPDKDITPETVYKNRREILKAMGFSALGIAGALYAPPVFASQKNWARAKEILAQNELNTEFKKIPSLERNPDYTVNRPITPEIFNLQYNNFYEFSAQKDNVWKLVDQFRTRPWQVEIAGMVEKPGVYDIDDLIRSMPVEERVYRHRCVETWAMVAPWNGFPMRELIKKVQPRVAARFVKFISFLEPDVAPGQRNYTKAPWPYVEGLTLDEADNELTFLATGMYGHTLPPQNGAPIRLVVPWKYGFKSAKSIVKIEFTDRRPATFWNTLVPEEYGFEANVDPGERHPRWSQRREKMIDSGDVFATVKYNGYGDFVADLYE